MKKQVAYLMSGNAHMPYLVCSLWTLRQHYQGNVVICAWPESYQLALKVAEDERLAITDVREREPATRKGKSTQSMDKIRMVQGMVESDVTMYIDADTTIHNPIDDLFKHGYKHGFAATQFCDWVTTGNKISHRIKKLRDFPIINQQIVELLLKESWPSVNSGIFAARPDSVVFDTYYDWTKAAAVSVFIADEVVLHTMQPLYNGRGMATICGGKWNCSPKFQQESLKDEDVVVMHYHGDSNVQPNTKSPRGFQWWWPIYQECLLKNVGNIQDWRWKIKNKFMNPLEEEWNHELADPKPNWC